ncbi:MAG: response regulator [Candidatus Hodarchaeota archaeon]
MGKDSFELGKEAEIPTHDLIRDNTVMIVEDDKDLLELYSVILEKINWQIIATSSNGIQAMKLYNELAIKPDVIILDLKLPGFSGDTVAKLILEKNPDQKIIFISGNCDLLNRNPYLKYFPRISKPFTISQLIEKLGKIKSDLLWKRPSNI